MKYRTAFFAMMLLALSAEAQYRREIIVPVDHSHERRIIVAPVDHHSYVVPVPAYLKGHAPVPHRHPVKKHKKVNERKEVKSSPPTQRIVVSNLPLSAEQKKELAAVVQGAIDAHDREFMRIKGEVEEKSRRLRKADGDLVTADIRLATATRERDEARAELQQSKEPSEGSSEGFTASLRKIWDAGRRDISPSTKINLLVVLIILVGVAVLMFIVKMAIRSRRRFKSLRTEGPRI